MPAVQLLRRVIQWVAVAAVWTGLTGNVRATDGAASLSRSMLPQLSPIAETVAGVCDAWRAAEKFAATHAHCDVMVGRGDSMLPLYRDRTVLVIQSVATAELQAGMTVVFIGDHGHAVAHTLLEKTATGWRAIGMGNREPDRTRVRRANLLGVVVRAYTPGTGASGELLAAQ